MKERILQYSMGYYDDPTYGIVLSCEHRDILFDIKLHIAGNWYEVKRIDYLIKIGSDYQCQLCLRDTGVEDGRWYLGTSFMAGYYMQFDRTAGTITMNHAASGTKGPWAEDNTAPVNIYGINWTTVGLLIMGIGICVILFVVICIFAFCYLLRMTMLAASMPVKVKKDESLGTQLHSLIASA